MSTWICVKKCQWGREPKLTRMWKVGEVVDNPTRPNKHFINPNKVEEEFKFDDKEADDINPEDMQLMTKKQLNDKFSLDLDENNLRVTKKDELIKMVINKNKVDMVKKQ